MPGTQGISYGLNATKIERIQNSILVNLRTPKSPLACRADRMGRVKIISGLCVGTPRIP